MFELKNKIALVTGGRRGMGRTHALALAKQGAKIVVTDIDANECAPVVEEIQSQGGEAVCFKMDVSNKAEVDRVFVKAMLQRVPLKRIGKPEEVSAMVVFLASEEASYITGATFYVDGGWLAT